MTLKNLQELVAFYGSDPRNKILPQVLAKRLLRAWDLAPLLCSSSIVNISKKRGISSPQAARWFEEVRKNYDPLLVIKAQLDDYEAFLKKLEVFRNRGLPEEPQLD